jgi:hypothetical protein
MQRNFGIEDLDKKTARRAKRHARRKERKNKRDNKKAAEDIKNNPGAAAGAAFGGAAQSVFNDPKVKDYFKYASGPRRSAGSSSG